MARKTLFPKRSTTNALEENELDQHSSKVSTACTTEDHSVAFPKVGGRSEATKKRRHHAKSSKKHGKSRTATTKSSVAGASQSLPQVTAADLSVLDDQLDQLIIRKPQAFADLKQQTGKDRSLKEAFLRRPPNNIVTILKSPIPNRPPTVFFNYPPFL